MRMIVINAINNAIMAILYVFSKNPGKIYTIRDIKKNTILVIYTAFPMYSLNSILLKNGKVDRDKVLMNTIHNA
tara:strand:- start:325 stop:546 length:222 start_codon:yes stop_codon:yes gene_type:complete